MGAHVRIVASRNTVSPTIQCAKHVDPSRACRGRALVASEHPGLSGVCIGFVPGRDRGGRPPMPTGEDTATLRSWGRMGGAGWERADRSVRKQRPRTRCARGPFAEADRQNG